MCKRLDRTPGHMTHERPRPIPGRGYPASVLSARNRLDLLDASYWHGGQYWSSARVPGLQRLAANT